MKTINYRRGSTGYFIILALLLFFIKSVFGQTYTVKQLETQRKAALEDIELTTQLLNETRSSAKTSLNRLNLLSKQVLTRKKVISLLNQEISSIDKDIADMNNEIRLLEKGLNMKRDKYAKSIQGIYTRHSSQYKWLFVLSADNFAQSIRRMRYIREYADWQKSQAYLIVKKQEEINQKQLELEQIRSEKLTLLSNREQENKKLQTEEIEQREEVQQLSKKQKNLQEKLNQKKKQAEALNRQIEKLIAEATVRSGKSSRESSRKAETSGGYAMTKEEQKLSTDFASNRGRLPFPLSGKYKIVSPFGEHQHPEWKHVRINNNGIDIQTTNGTEAKSVFNGIVTSVFVLPGYNHGIIVRHGNYLTIYANLSEVYVDNGDKVSTSQKLGKIFTDKENDNTTILHFEIRKEKDKLNPEIWLN